MGFYRGANVVTSGLVLALDAANTKSYPGSGTTWSDLSGNGNTGTLTNGPTFNSANGGSIAFDGIDDYTNLGLVTQLTNITNVSVNAWVYPVTSSTTVYVSRYFNTTLNNGWLIRYMHAVGASMFFVAVYLHIFRGLYYGSYKTPRELLWQIGLIIFLTMMATAFMGYVLP
jgi:hypothetical protein